MTPEQIEGYLKRLNVRYSHDDEPGPDGVFRVRFETAMYRSTMPPRGKRRLQVIVSLSHGGEVLTLTAPYVYHLSDARKRGVFCEYLIDLNYRIKIAQFQMDRRDGEVACEVCVPVKGSNVSFDSFQRLLYVIPFVVEFHHEDTIAVMKKGKLPPVPKVPQVDLLLVDVLQRAGSVAKLREIVDAHEERTRGSDKRSRKGTDDGLLNPLPPSRDPTRPPVRNPSAGGANPGDPPHGGTSPT